MAIDLENSIKGYSKGKKLTSEDKMYIRCLRAFDKRFGKEDIVEIKLFLSTAEFWVLIAYLSGTVFNVKKNFSSNQTMMNHTKILKKIKELFFRTAKPFQIKGRGS